MPNPVGRPPGPAKPVAPPTASTRVIITDERPELGTPRHVGAHEHVPGDLMDREVIKRFAVPEHLTVYRISEGNRRIIQQGRRQ